MTNEIFKHTYCIFVGTEEQMKLYSDDHPDVKIIMRLGTDNSRDCDLLMEIGYFMLNLGNILISSGTRLWEVDGESVRSTMLEIIPGNCFWEDLALLIGQWIAERYDIDCYLAVFNASGKIEELYS